MKSAKFLFFFFLIVTVDDLLSQPIPQFGNDIIAHYEFGKNDLNSATDVAFNGWIYLANSNTDYQNINLSEINLSVSKDGGLTWQILSNVIPPSDIGAVNDIEVTGDDTAHIRVYISCCTNNTLTLLPRGFVKLVDGLTGAILPFNVEIGDGSYTVSSVKLATDKHHTGNGSIGNSIGIVYETESDGTASNDSIVCLISNDTSSTAFTYNLIDTSAILNLQYPNISYGYSPTWNTGKFFIAYQKNGHIAYCKSNGTLSSGFTIPIIVDNLASSELNFKPTIVCQNSNTDNDSAGLSTLIFDYISDSAGIKMNIFYNMQSSASDYWNQSFITGIQPADFSFLQGAICFSEYNNNFYFTGYDRSNSSLFIINENFNFTNQGNWPIVSTKYNDSTYNINHITNPAISTFSNYIYTSWCSNLTSQVYNTLFDFEMIPLNTNVTNDNYSESFVIYPNPVQEKLFIDFPQKLKTTISKISIIDLTNRIISNVDLENDQYKISIDVSKLKAGLYFISLLYSNGSTTTKRFIKN